MSEEEHLVDVSFFVIHNVKTEKVELTPEGIRQIAAADIIMAVDPVKGSRYVLRGLETLKRMVAEGKTEPLPVLTVRVNEDTDDVERIAAAVKVVHGNCDPL